VSWQSDEVMSDNQLPIPSDIPKPDMALPGIALSDSTVVLSAKDIQALGIARAEPVNKDEVTQTMRFDEVHTVLPKGTKIAEFEITGVIGQGGFGIVYEALDASLQRLVAIKEYMPASLAVRQSNGFVVPRSQEHKESFETGLRSFVNEARLLARFDHPSLLKVYRFWDERGTTYMVMPLYKGVTLKQALAKDPSFATEPWLTKILDGVTQALGMIHAADCYHRDIAPDNIMLVGEDFHPVVLDFGAARRVITGMTQALTVILKPGYAPVEQYAESPDMKQGPWTDIYALGAVIYVAVCKKPPPPSVTRLLADNYKRLVDDTELRSRYSERFLAAIDAALAVRPEQRPQAMAEFRGLLALTGGESIAHNSQVTTQPLQPLNKPKLTAADGKANKSSKAMAGLTMAGLFIGALAVAGFWWSNRPANSPSAVLPSSSGATAAPDVKRLDPTAVQTPAPTLDGPAIFDGILKASTADITVSAVPKAGVVKTARKDKLEFSVTSAVEGHVYVYLLSSAGDMLQLFPNQLDKRNRIKVGETLRLPRASWPLEAGGPAGTNRFIAVVTKSERDFANSGIQSDGVFGRLPIEAVAGLERAKRPGAAPVVLGQAKCASGAVCDEAFGAASFSITEE
jgi:serine/threonine protein kinase